MITRRDAVLATLTTGFSGFSLGQTPRIRKNISKLMGTNDDLQDYMTAVSRLVKLPKDDPRNWNNISSLHADYCPHGNWWFLPWHRAYLYYFEKICQDVLQKPEFALPYWDWTSTPRVPAAFWTGILSGSGMKSPLSRKIDPNIELSSEFVGRRVIDGLMRSNSLQAIYSGAPRSAGQRSRGVAGEFESTPHDNVHNSVGGIMATMQSPTDPIFWLHHANIDRLWASWQATHNNQVPSDNSWENHPLEKFWDAGARKFVTEPTSKTATLAPYSYNYDKLEGQANALFAAKTLSVLPGLSLVDLAKTGKPVSLVEASSVRLNSARRFSLPGNDRISASIERVVSVDSAMGTTPANFEPQRILVVIEGVKRPPDATAMRVFLNCQNPSVNTPIDDPSYVGVVGFFALDHEHGHDHGDENSASYSLNATDTVARLARSGGNNYKPGDLEVSLVPISVQKTAVSGAVTASKIAVVTEGT